MPLTRLVIGVFAAIALTIAPLGAFCPAAKAAEATAAAHAGGMHPCPGDEPAPEGGAVIHCALLCGFFMLPGVEIATPDFARVSFEAKVATQEGAERQPPAPPPRA